MLKKLAFITLLHTLRDSVVFGQESEACKTRSGLAEDPQFCDRFYECQDGVAVRQDCPNGLVYTGRRRRGILGGCEYAWQSNTACEGKQLANSPIATEHCEWLYGIFGHETSCTRYWTCWNGTATEQFCIGGLLYNEETRACDWPENVKGCQKHPLCKEDPNGNVPLGKSCNRYWHCQGGYPRLQRCPSGLVFDKAALVCVVPPTEECDVPSTTSRPEEEETQQENRVDGNRERSQGTPALPQPVPANLIGGSRFPNAGGGQQQTPSDQQTQGRPQPQQIVFVANPNGQRGAAPNPSGQRVAVPPGAQQFTFQQQPQG